MDQTGEEGLLGHGHLTCQHQSNNGHDRTENNDDNPQDEVRNVPKTGLAALMGESFAEQIQQAPEIILNPWQCMFDAFAATKKPNGVFEFPRDMMVQGENLYQWLEHQTYYHVPARIRKFEAIGFDLDTFANLSLLPSGTTQQSSVVVSGNSGADSQSQLGSTAAEDESAEPSENDVHGKESVTKAPNVSVNKPPSKPQRQSRRHIHKVLQTFTGYREAARQFESEPSKVHSYSMQISASYSIQISAVQGKLKLCRHGFFW